MQIVQFKCVCFIYRLSFWAASLDDDSLATLLQAAGSIRHQVDVDVDVDVTVDADYTIEIEAR